MSGFILEARQEAASGIYQILDPLTDDEFFALKADIERNGVLIPVEYDEHGHILDGHHRVAICKMLGITEWPRFVRKGLSEEEKRSFARSINFNRRHLSTAQKQKVIEAQLKDDPSASNRAIAAKLGVDHKTVAGARTRLEVTGEIPQLERTLGADGKERRKPIQTMFMPERDNLPEMKLVLKAVESREHIEKVASYLGALKSNEPPAETVSVPALIESPRANLRAAVGTSTRTNADRGFNLYETPDEGMFTLLALEEFSSQVKEMACGRGAISRRLEAAGYGVILSDLIDYGTTDRHGNKQSVQDFLQTQADGTEGVDIVTNPPYGAVLNAFIAHALRVHRPRKMALLLNLNFLCGFDDPDRVFAMEECPPARVLIFKRRLPMMHHDDYYGPEASSRMNTAWFIWEMDADGSYGQHGDTRIRRVDWKDYMPADGAIAPEGGAV